MKKIKFPSSTTPLQFLTKIALNFMKRLFIGILLAAIVNIAGAQAPANDNFAKSQTIGNGSITTNIANATLEAGEIDTTSGKTVWYNYTATADSIVTLDTTGTAFRYHFATVYMGTEINNLIYIDGGYSSSWSITPLNFSFKAKAGSTYMICAGLKGTTYFNGNGSEIKLTLYTTPFNHVGSLYGNTPSKDGYVANDRFENRVTLTGNTLTAINYIASASVEAGEPDTKTGNTAWYTYTATSDSEISIDTTGTEFRYSFVSVYMGNSINNLMEITSALSSNSEKTPFTLNFKAKAGTTYQICVGCLNSSSIKVGETLLQFTLTTTPFAYVGKLYGPEAPTAPTPKNDSFYTPQILTEDKLTIIGSNTSATIEAGESGISRSLWYSWTATSDKLVIVDFPGQFPKGTFGVFTGNSPQTASLVPSIPGGSSTTYAFNAAAGTTYKFLVASTSSNNYGPFQLTLTATTPKPNDAPVAKFTWPKNGKTVSAKGFYITANLNDDDGISAFQIKVAGKLIMNKSFPYNGKIFSGKVKKGKVTLQIRAKDTRGKWGNYQTIKVNAK